MSTETQGSATEELKRLLVEEFCNVPIDRWGYFFPCLVALWRFVETARPGVFGELKASYTDQPYFEGKGAEWFSSFLSDDTRSVDLLEEIFYPVAKSLPASALDRGFATELEITDINDEAVSRLAEHTLHSVEHARGAGLL